MLHFDHVAAIGTVNAWSWTTAVSATNTPGRVLAFVKIICSSQRALFIVVVRVHRCVSIREVRPGPPPKLTRFVAAIPLRKFCVKFLGAPLIAIIAVLAMMGL